jgi:hypothetical protein
MALCSERNSKSAAPAEVHFSPSINLFYVCDFEKGQGGNFTKNLIRTNPLDSPFNLLVSYS